MSGGCEICERIARFTPDNPYLIAELSTGYAVLSDNQYYPGYAIFVAKQCVPELHDLALMSLPLPQERRSRRGGCRPQVRKLNYELPATPVRTCTAPLPSLRR
jgi:hypothetical protein